MKYERYIGLGFHRWNQGYYSPGQLAAFHDYKNPFILLTGSYRGGKSELGDRACIRHMHSFPGAKVGVFRQHQASLKKSTLLNFLELIHPSWVLDWSNTDLIMTLKNGSTAFFIGAEHTDRLGSIELTMAFIDEASELSSASINMISGRLSGALQKPRNFEYLPEDRQAYIEETLGVRQLLMATNPKSTGHFLYRDFIEAPKPGHASYTSNSVSNRNLPVTYLETNLAAYARRGVTSDWIKEQVRRIRAGEAPSDGLYLVPKLTPFGQRNLLGLWVAMEGAIYDLEAAVHLVRKPPETWGDPVAFYGAVDFGFQNPRLIIASRHYYYQGDRQIDCYAVVKYWAGTQATPDDLIEAMLEADKEFNVTEFYLPHDQPGISKTARASLGAKIRRARVEVFAGINVVSRFFNSERLLLLERPGHELAWKELEGYRWKTDREGNFLDEPVKEDDHYPDAIRYLIASRHLREQMPEKNIPPQPRAIPPRVYSLSDL